VQLLLDFFVEHAPSTRARGTSSREVAPGEEPLTGFVFKIQANMDPQHRDRVAFMRICSGHFTAGMKTFHVRTGKDMKIANALTFMASDREIAIEAWPGDVIGIHNHGTISIGDSFSEGEAINFTGIPNFAPELFRRARLRDPLKLKQLQKGLAQLSEEGATQFFRPLMSNDLILGAVGTLQFDVVAYRLKDEYSVDASFEVRNGPERSTSVSVGVYVVDPNTGYPRVNVFSVQMGKRDRRLPCDVSAYGKSAVSLSEGSTQEVGGIGAGTLWAHRHGDDKTAARDWTGVNSWAVNDWARIDLMVKPGNICE
jgi:hypothetical protein